MVSNFDKINISIVMPTFNRASTIGLAIESVLNQSLKQWELIIVDNESTDTTAEVVEKYVQTDPRVKYYSVKKSTKPGISEYLNFGINLSSGKYIARLDDDDEWCHNDKLKIQYDYLEQNPEVVLIGGGAIMVDVNRQPIYKFFKREFDSQIRNNALLANPFWHNTVLYRKDIVLKIGGYRNYRFVEDWDLWLRLGNHGKFYNFQKYFSLYMNAGQNLSVNNQKLAAKTILKLIKTYKDIYPNYYKALILIYFQFLFSLLPVFIKKRTQNFLFYIKRNYF